MPNVNLDKVIASLKLAIDEVTNVSSISQLKKEYLGPDSIIAKERHNLSQYSDDQKKKIGPMINDATKEMESLLESATQKFELEASKLKEQKEKTDISINWYEAEFGSHHVLTSTMQEVVEIFSNIGFKVESGPEAETSWHNFDALNTPIWHPARYESDTLYLDYGDKNSTLLRTQTSTVQARHMQKNEPPIFIVVPGRVFRSDQLDATHSPVFHQIEGLAVDEGVTFTDLKGTLEYFAKEFFGKNTKTKFIPHFFPFTEPSAEMLVQWKDDEWLEILGCGMVDPNVFKNVGYKKHHQGYAFGMGVERLSMIRYGIDHIKNFYDNDLRFLQQFK
ncbi:MAG: phenylalanine--tRNA ligase subunit alpha [Actinobacteria bacterium]|nr:phenylalanine--tRNA ligase subunit alpha [Actinomycetota bacterium]|tara:strand:- start:4178 stop:5179 length:1002 start_codon:yes stop_codon:yes gene_type:complete